VGGCLSFHFSPLASPGRCRHWATKPTLTISFHPFLSPSWSAAIFYIKKNDRDKFFPVPEGWIEEVEESFLMSLRATEFDLKLTEFDLLDHGHHFHNFLIFAVKYTIFANNKKVFWKPHITQKRLSKRRRSWFTFEQLQARMSCKGSKV
jgi:hypothetical protein